jgi:XTP/dITP diphosphohydrolase
LVRLVIATTSPDKLREIRDLLGPLNVDLLSLRDFPAVPEPEETGTTFEANARIKAIEYDRTVTQPAASVQCGPLYTVAEDSGIVIDALDGEPGVYSARFLRPDATYAERFAEIYRRMELRPQAPRTTRFVCAVAVVRAGTIVFETRGTVEGLVAPVPDGTHGFGYDPIFYYPPYKKTLAAVSQAEKVAVAHRGVAFRKLADWLAKGKI